MKYMADTIVKYVLGETNRHSGMLRFVLPSYPSDLLLEIGCELDEQFSRITDRRVDWEYKIAYRLGKEWENGTSGSTFLSSCSSTEGSIQAIHALC
jgi:DNA phosphorothioation-dependent restriction protein DptH